MSTVVQAYQFALDPNPEQQAALASHCGAQRVAFNWGLARVKANMAQREAERSYGVLDDELTPALSWSTYSLRKDWNAAKHDVAPWWGENSKEAYSSGLANLAAALENWNKSRKGQRAGHKAGFPRFRSKHTAVPSVRFTTGAFGLAKTDRRHVKVPRIGAVRTHESTRKLARHLERGTARIRSTTVSLRRGRWLVSFSVEIDRREAEPATPGGTVGVDRGVKHLAVLSTGETVDNPRHLDQAQRELRRLQRQAARRFGRDRRSRRAPSNRWRKTHARIARTHTKVANARRDGLHKLTTRLVNGFDTVVVEDLHVAGMVANRSLARVVSEVGMAEVRRQLDYTTAWRGRRLVVADRWFPSSKTCNDCGAVKAKLRLSERTFACEACGVVVDRDHNAARNLADLASSHSWWATENEPAGNPRKPTPGGGDGYGHGKTPDRRSGANAAPQGDGSGTLSHVS